MSLGSEPHSIGRKESVDWSTSTTPAEQEWLDNLPMGKKCLCKN